MVVDETMTEQDYVSAQFLHMKPRRAFAVLGALIVVLFVLTLILHPSYIMAGVVAYFVILFFQ